MKTYQLSIVATKCHSSAPTHNRVSMTSGTTEASVVFYRKGQGLWMHRLATESERPRRHKESLMDRWIGGQIGSIGLTSWWSGRDWLIDATTQVFLHLLYTRAYKNSNIYIYIYIYICQASQIFAKYEYKEHRAQECWMIIWLNSVLIGVYNWQTIHHVGYDSETSQ
jgi:hypothetical protein